MQKKYLILSTFVALLLIIVIAQRMQREVVRSTEVTFTKSENRDNLGNTYAEGSRDNPVATLSGKTYRFVNSNANFTAELPIEFKDLVPSDLSYVDIYLKGDAATVSVPFYSFQIHLRQRNPQLTADQDLFSVFLESLLALEKGQSYTYNRLTDQEKIELVEDGVSDSFFNNDTVYTKVDTIGNFAIFYWESRDIYEPTYGYTAVAENNTELVTIELSLFFQDSEQARKDALDIHKSLFWKIIESATFSN